MGWQDRTYASEEEYRGSPGGGGGGLFGRRLSSHSMVLWLLIINFVIFLLDSIVTGSRRASVASPFEWGYFSIDTAIYSGQVWRFLTYQFLHAGFLHILFNLIVLFFFGPMMEAWWGSRRFLAFYLLCGVSGVVIYTPLALMPGLLGVTPETPLVGASGCMFGILAGAATIAPNQRVMLLFPPIPMKMRTLVLIFLGIAVFSVLVGSHGAGGEAAHLGGALLGWLLVRNPRWLNWADRNYRPGVTSLTDRWRQRASDRQRRSKEKENAEVDRILQKVKDHGLQSLTSGEKRTLQRATDRQRRAG